MWNNTTGVYNIAIGEQTLDAHDDCNYCIAIGNSALGANQSDYMVAIGQSALVSNTTGIRNTAIGTTALGHITTEDDCVAVGYQALHPATGHENTSVGSTSGFVITTGNSNTFLGFAAGNHASQKIDAANSMALGANSYTDKDNQVVIGASTITETLIRGLTGVNEVTIAAQLDVCQSNIAGAIPVLELDQDDEDDVFINFVGTSAADQTKSISTVNGDGAVTGPKNFSASAGWEYVGMVKIEINGSPYWMAYYQPDTA